MRYKRAVEKLRVLAEACERVKMFWFDTEPFLKAVYAFGEVVDGADPLDAVQVAVAINLVRCLADSAHDSQCRTGHRQVAPDTDNMTGVGSRRVRVSLVGD